MAWFAQEPRVTEWLAVDDDALRGHVLALLRVDRPALILVDGRSGSGKSTLAARLAAVLDAGVVHTDDIAWQHHPTDWADLLVAGILEPWRSGCGGSFRPPRWVAKNRPGAIEVPTTRILVAEGVGAGRSELAASADLVVWVQADPEEARRRGILRDMDLGRTRAQAEDFWEEWGRFEDPFLAADRPWTRAHLIIDGTARGADGDTRLAIGPISAG